MKADNNHNTTGHNRTIRFSDYQTKYADDPQTLDVRLMYTGEANAASAVVLDGVIIPELVRAVNTKDEVITALVSSLLILSRDGVRVLQGEAFWTTEREQIADTLKKIAPEVYQGWVDFFKKENNMDWRTGAALSQ